ncbi:UDP-N-acetylglucosamine transferase subunit ALG14-like [Hondaea fermentalgiana]|uniref:UDP-N-acetylglucosamine transferase subunit ALG14-like n=1 Tax=Hondaea fermentalgiana TaxID=2315210 RepID=A0A2R5GTN5_9STRA|nr:UDP-N-acetylglucosamine transferase subunit ALG14-like [Hondaea fermentalgiana]|eukprot:GBG34226.1 UDP-N-acetylglucosamine transferase subunit ALG14-like [Hondaea fermentalgiana]
MAPVHLTPLDVVEDHKDEEELSRRQEGDGVPELQDLVVRWVLDRARKVEDTRFASHGTTHAAKKYEAFAERREKSDKLRPEEKLFNAKFYYDTRSYECRDVPSERPGTLRLIFDYYASLLTPNAVNTGLTDANAPLTLALIEVANNTISLTELVTFASNYGLVPDIISHAGLHFAWQRQRRTCSNEHPTELDYAAFVEVLARCALIAFQGDAKARIDQLIDLLDLRNTRKHAAMLEALEKTRNGKHRPTKNIRHAPVSLDDKARSGNRPSTSPAHGRRESKINPHGFEMVSTKRKRWSRITVDADPSMLSPAAAGTNRRNGASVPPSFENDPQRKNRKSFWRAEELWDPTLLELLAPFEFENHRKRWLPFEGEYLDMGVLVCGSTHNFRIVVQNKCPFTTHTAMHFEGVPGADLLLDPREMAVGLSREAIVHIACRRAGEHHGSLRIRLLDSEDQVVQERKIPVYCNIGNLAEDAMRRGIRPSKCYLLFLSKTVFEGAVRMELETALQEEKPILLVHESDPNRVGFDIFSSYIKSALDAAKHLFRETESMPYQRPRDTTLRIICLPLPPLRKRKSSPPGLAALTAIFDNIRDAMQRNAVEETNSGMRKLEGLMKYCDYHIEELEDDLITDQGTDDVAAQLAAVLGLDPESGDKLADLELVDTAAEDGLGAGGSSGGLGGNAGSFLGASSATSSSAAATSKKRRKSSKSSTSDKQEIARLKRLVKKLKDHQAAEVQKLMMVKQGVEDLVSSLSGTKQNLKDAKKESLDMTKELESIHQQAVAAARLQKEIAEIQEHARINYETGQVELALETGETSQLTLDEVAKKFELAKLEKSKAHQLYNSEDGREKAGPGGKAYDKKDEILSKLADPAVLHADLRLLLDIVLLLGSATIGGMLAAVGYMPPLIGYIAGGVIVGPSGLDLVYTVVEVDTLAQFGSVFFLFAHGLEYSFSEQRQFQTVAVGGCFLSTAICAVCIQLYALGSGIVQSPLEGGLLGLSSSLSSLSLVLDYLHDQQLLHTVHGKVMVGFLTFQGFLMGLLFSLPPAISGGVVSVGGVGLALFRSLSGILFVAAFAYLFSRYALPTLLEFLSKNRSNYDELYLLGVVSLAMVMALLTEFLGLSLDLGAFFAGLMLAGTPYMKRTMAAIQPLASVFAALLFASIGMIINPSFFWTNLGVISIVVIQIVVIKVIVGTTVVRLFSYSWKVSVFTGIGLAHVGEFSLLFSSKLQAHLLLSRRAYLIFLAATVTTIVLAPLVLRMMHFVLPRILRILNVPEDEEEDYLAHQRHRPRLNTWPVGQKSERDDASAVHTSQWKHKAGRKLGDGHYISSRRVASQPMCAPEPSALGGTCSTLMVLGSGGHTTEMLALVQNMSERYAPLNVVLADTDKTSLPKFEASSPLLASRATTHPIRRSREVGQSYISSAWTTAAATIDSIAVVMRTKPRLVLCNGPGTCVPVCIGALLLRFLGLGDPCIIFVESFCRVKTLSLTGKILYGIADRFIVQWPELADQFPRAEYVGTLF